MQPNIKNKIKKQDIILFICIFIFAMIANIAFLQRHYSSDTMCLIDLGYFEYPSQYFLLDGRIFSTLVCYLGGILNLPVDTYLFISNFIGIFLLALTTIILFKFTINYLDIEIKWIKFLTLLSIYTIIFNHMDIDYLLFPESCVMCAGVLFSVLAVIAYLSDKKGKLIKSFILLILSVLCYQGLISIFPTLVIALSFLKRRENTKETFKFYIKEVIKVGIMFTLAFLTSALLIILFSSILQNSNNRIERIKQIFTIIYALPQASFNLMLEQTKKIPLYLSVVVMTVSNIIIILYSDNVNKSIKYILVIFTAYLFCMLPSVVFTYTQSRMLMAVGAIMGISLLFITTLLNNNKENISFKNIKTILISTCVILYFIFNVVNNYLNGYEHLKAFALDEETGAKINQIIKNYEEESGIEVTKFSYFYDTDPQSYEEGIKELGSLTERKFAMPWCIKQSLNYYCNKKLKLVEFPKEIYQGIYDMKNYTEFSEEQFIFIDDTMYIYTY